MLKLSRLQDLNARQNPTEAEKKELSTHMSEFSEALVKVQTDFGIQITAQLAVEIPEPEKHILT